MSTEAAAHQFSLHPTSRRLLVVDKIVDTLAAVQLASASLSDRVDVERRAQLDGFRAYWRAFQLWTMPVPRRPWQPNVRARLRIFHNLMHNCAVDRDNAHRNGPDAGSALSVGQLTTLLTLDGDLPISVHARLKW